MRTGTRRLIVVGAGTAMLTGLLGTGLAAAASAETPPPTGKNGYSETKPGDGSDFTDPVEIERGTDENGNPVLLIRKATEPAPGTGQPTKPAA